MNQGQLVFGNGFSTLINRTLRERLQNERQLAERRMTKYRLEARKSCAPDATSYRISLRQFKRWLRGLAQ
jgi:hypothetical protein